MAFPGTYNISYYKGDTYEFRIYPKTADGDVFDLTPYIGGENEKMLIHTNVLQKFQITKHT